MSAPESESRPEAAAEPGADAATWRQRWRRPLLLAAPAVVLAGLAYAYLFGGRYQGTDNAYTQAPIVQVSANVAGRVSAVRVSENQFVHRGDELFRLDDAPFDIAVRDASARLAAARLQVAALKSAYRQRQAEMRAAEDTLAYQQREFDRQSRLLAAGIASQAQVDSAAHGLDAARQALAAAGQRARAALDDLGGAADIAPEQHPLVRAAQAVLARAQLELSYTVVVAPQDGVVTRVDRLQVGDYISAATPLFALVGTRDTWIEANFKEDQLAHMRPGQSATVTIDRYPDRRFRAVVASLSPGTGAQFSVLPAENATGNWVKVVQRVPVRLRLLDVDAAHPLEAGLSADVSVDTRSAASAPAARPASAIASR